MKKLLLVVVIAVTAALFAAPADAATRCVKPGGSSGCAATIQAAVTAAAAGDTVLVYPGRYYENITVPMGRDGLKIVGTSRAASIIDGSSNSATMVVLTNNILSINSNAVQVRNLTLQNGETHAIAISGDDTIVQAVTFLGTGATYVKSGVTGTRFLANDLRSVTSKGFWTGSGNTGTIVRLNRFAVCDSGCISVNGDASKIEYNVIYQSEDWYGIEADGDNVTITGNTISGAETIGIGFTGDTATIQYNKINLVSGSGIEASGPNLTIRYNVIKNSDGFGIYAYYAGNGGTTANTVSFNTVTNVTGTGVHNQGGSIGAVANANRVTGVGEDGVYVRSYDTLGALYGPATASNNIIDGSQERGLVIEGSATNALRNNIRDTQSTGIAFRCTAADCGTSQVSYNLVTNTGEDSAGIDTTAIGSDLVVSFNTVYRSMGQAFRMRQSDSAITSNKAFDQGGDSNEACFLIEGSSNRVSANQALRCSENGFEVSGSSNVLSANTSSGNLGSGYSVVGAGNSLTLNKSTSNIGAGFAVLFTGSANTIAPSNVSALNRVDFCDEGSQTNAQPFATTALKCDIVK